MKKRLLALLGFLAWQATAVGQVSIQFPTTRFVAQRDLANRGRLYIAAQVLNTADLVEAQLTPMAPGQGVATGWQTIQTNPGTTVVGSVTGVAGWYQLTVRAMNNGYQVASATLAPVGIGEVFITAGQSNSRGLGPYDNDLGAVTDRVSTIDDIRYSLPPSSPVIHAPNTPMPYTSYVPMTAGKRIFPMGESSWGWGELGDYLVQRFNVPVAFYSVGWDASTVNNWNRTAHGLPTCNRYYCVADWPYLQPYSNLKNVLRYYAATGGIRAVLWHQGESEWSATIPHYATGLDSLIRKTRADFNGRTVPFMVARVSFDGQNTNATVVQKQQQVIQTPNFQVFEGPLNDTIQNRLGGTVDVHFGNASQLSPHPEYYKNSKGIPQNMGLSRFARNWNNSLTNAFFQNAQPVLPTQFAATAKVVSARTGGGFSPGDSVAVSFVTTGTFGAGNQWQVQVLDPQGRHRATLGSGTTSPIRVRWPDTLGVGTYRVRVFSSNPMLASAPTPEFALRPTADLQLSATARRRVLPTGDSTTIYLTIQNTSNATTQNVLIQSRLPANVSATEATPNVWVDGSTVNASVSNLNAGESRTLAFRARLNVSGQYHFAAEVMQADNGDPDSQAASGTADGQDDAVQLDLRTYAPGGTFLAPNTNQTPLPPVRLNQPTPDPNKADLSLRLAVNTRTPKVNELVSYTLVVSNYGGLAASNVSVVTYLPAGVNFVQSNQMAPGNAGISGTVTSIPAGGSGTLQFTARPVSAGTLRTRAQVLSATPADPDSTPGNATGTLQGEDDEAVVDFRVR